MKALVLGPNGGAGFGDRWGELDLRPDKAQHGGLVDHSPDLALPTLLSKEPSKGQEREASQRTCSHRKWERKPSLGSALLPGMQGEVRLAFSKALRGTSVPMGWRGGGGWGADAPMA